MNNSLASLSNLSRWRKSLTSSCNFCCQIQTTKHVLSGCTPCLDRYTWRHNSILLNIANILKPLVTTIYVDLPGRFLYPDSITGASHRPDMILIDSENKMYETIFYDAELSPSEYCQICSHQSHYCLHKNIILHILHERERLDDTRAYRILTMHRSND